MTPASDCFYLNRLKVDLDSRSLANKLILAETFIILEKRSYKKKELRNVQFFTDSDRLLFNLNMKFPGEI